MTAAVQGMIGELRLLPIMIVAATLMLGMKLGDLWRGAEQVMAGLAVARAQAQESQVGTGAAPAEAETPEADLFVGAGGDEKSTLRQRLRARIEALVEEELEALLERQRPPPDMEVLFTRAEVEILQSLTQRREALEARARELDLREGLLGAAEKRIDEKIAELEKIEAAVQASLKTHDAEEEAKMKSVVKIYENMKAKDAARIFEELDMKILLDVAERMRGAKIAPILAQMNPAKAQAITVELATRRQLPATGG